MNLDSPEPWEKRLPRARSVDRYKALADLCHGRDVVHVGFVDTECADLLEQRGAGRLHEHLARASRTMIGLDADCSGVLAACSAGHNAHCVDCTDADAVRDLRLPLAQVVVAGEILEHLSDCGGFLEAMKTVVDPEEGVLVVTTPNASRIFNALSAIARVELAHPDHVGAFSYATLRALLLRHGWTPVEWMVYGQVRNRPAAERPLRLYARHPRVAFFRLSSVIERLVSRWAPFTAAGLIVVCSRSDQLHARALK